MTGSTPWSLVGSRPAVSVPDATELLRTGYGLAGELRSQPSERDQSFAVVVEGVPRYVLKIANRVEDPAALDLQHAAMTRLAAHGLPVPTVLPAGDGRSVLRHDGHLVHVLSFLPGRLLAATAVRPAALFEDLGRTMGRVTVALDGFTHHAADRRLQWDVRSAGSVLAGYLDDIDDTERRARVAAVLRRFTAVIEPLLPRLPRSVIHNDANDHNILVEDARVTGVLDFGDMVRSATVHELAVACAYAMLDAPEPLQVARSVVAGFERARPLTDDERSLLPDLVRTRLATSVAVAEHQRRLDADPYLVVSAAPAWRLLERLAEVTW